MPAQKFQIEEHFDKWGRDLEKGLARGLELFGRVAQGSVSSHMTRVGPAGVGVTPSSHVKDSIRVSDPYRTPRGLAIDVYSQDPNAYWQEKGTRGKKGKAKSARTAARRREQGVGHSGVKPLRFFLRGLKAVDGQLVRSLRAGIR